MALGIRNSPQTQRALRGDIIIYGETIFPLRLYSAGWIGYQIIIPTGSD